MILKCNKTGKILWSTEEATKHAEDIGSQDFDEISAEQIIWVDRETGRKPFFSEDEVNRFRQRTRQPELQVDSITVKEYGERLTEHSKRFTNHPTIVAYAKKKLMDVLVDIKGISIVRAEKACWFTRNASIAVCEAWLEEHKDDPCLNMPIKELPDDPSHPAIRGAAPMEIDEAAAVTDTTATENPGFVKEKLNATYVEELLSMGFALLRVEKALYFTQSTEIANAVQWLTDHENDADIDIPLAQNQPVTPAAPKLSPEEAQKAAMEIQTRLKRERDEREKQESKDREKARVESMKLAAETNAQLAEEQLKRDRAERDREKREHEAHAAQLKERLRLDYIERFGVEPPQEDLIQRNEIKEKSSKEQIIFWLNEMKKAHKDDARLKQCMTTVKAYAGNAQKNPTDMKYLKIKRDNKAFQERVAWCPEALELIQALGFKDEVALKTGTGEFYAIQKSIADGWLMGQCVKFLDLAIERL